MTDVRIYSLAPTPLRDPTSGDPEGALRQYFDAVQQEMDRHRAETAGIAVLVDVDGLNTTFIFKSRPCFDFIRTPQQLVVINVASDGVTGVVQATGVVSDEDDFFVGYSVRALRPEEQGGTAHPLADSTTMVTDYVGATRTMTFSPPFSGGTSNGLGFELGYPRMVFLPPVDESLQLSHTAALTSQDEITFPNQVILPHTGFGAGAPVSTVDNYYQHWTIEFLDGPAAGITRTVESYDAESRTLVLDRNLTGFLPESGDQFQITLGRKASESTDFYTGYYVRVVGGFGSGPPIQTRRIDGYQVVRDVDGNVVSRILFVEQNWDQPPLATSTVGITQSFVSLSHIANMVGYSPDSTDPEILQKQQILSAVDFYKLKGTLRSFELLFRTFGFKSEIVELGSNYTNAPTDEPGVSEPIHLQSFKASKSGRPRRIESVALSQIFRDGTFESSVGAEDFPLWDTFGTANSSTLSVVSGECVVSSTQSGGLARATKAYRFPLDKGAVLDFDLVIASGGPSAGQSLRLVQVSDEETSPSAVWVAIFDANRTLGVEGTNFSAQLSTKTLSIGKRYHVRLRVLEHRTPSSDGIVQLYLDGDLVVDHYLTDTISDTAFIDSFSIYVLSSALFSAVVRIDNFTALVPTDALLDDGGGEDSVSGLLGGTLAIGDPNANTDVCVPDSDMLIFLQRVNPQVRFSVDVFRRILARLEDIRPVHVEIGLVGSAVDVTEALEVRDEFHGTYIYEFSETLSFEDDFSAFTNIISVPEGLVVSDLFEIDGGGFRWTSTGSRWGRGGRWGRN